MGVRLQLSCDGCDATADGFPLRKRFVPFSGHNLGFGTFQVDSPEALAPRGWVTFDPYTQATYCPACWTAVLDGGQTEG